MISLAAIGGVVMRHARVMKRDANAILQTLYWPLLDVFMWGFLGTWIQQSTSNANYQTTILLGLLLWQVVGRGSNTLGIAFCEELWGHNLVNLFSLPLRTIEWVIGVIVFTLCVTLCTSLFCMMVIVTLYHAPIEYLLKCYLIFAPPLFLSMIWLGFTALQVVVSLGKRGAELGFIIGWFLMPFSGAFYPVEVLPHWAQAVTTFLPMSYVFKGMREYVMFHHDPTPYLVKGYILAFVYAICAIGLFIYCFNRAKRGGIARLID